MNRVPRYFLHWPRVYLYSKSWFYIIQTEKRIYIYVNITNSIKDMFNYIQLIWYSFEINKVLFNILDFPTLINAMTDNSNFGYNEIIVKVPWSSNQSAFTVYQRTMHKFHKGLYWYITCPYKWQGEYYGLSCTWQLYCIGGERSIIHFIHRVWLSSTCSL